MTEDKKSHLTFALIGNLITVGLLIRSAWNGNDKAIIFVILFYPLLILVNGMIWMNLHSKKKRGVQDLPGHHPGIDHFISSRFAHRQHALTGQYALPQLYSLNRRGQKTPQTEFLISFLTNNLCF